MKRMNSIAMVMPTLGGGGAERVAVALSRYFIHRGYEFSFLLTKKNECVYELPEGVKVNPICDSAGTSPLDQIRGIRHEMKKDDSRIFLSFLCDQNVCLLAAAVGLRNKVVVSVRNLPTTDFYGRKALQYVRNFLYVKKSSTVVFQTKDQMSYFPSGVRRKGVLIPNPLSYGLPERNRACPRRVVTASGRLTEQKNYPMLIRAFSIVHKQIPDVTFEIYGDGELREDLELLVDSEGLTNCVVFCGFCGDAVQRIASSSVYVMASNWEGLSNSLIEALAVGVPSVCTRCLGGGAEAVVEDGVNGYLVDRDDHEAMAQRVVELLLDPVLRDSMSAEAAKLADDLSLETIGKKWEETLFPEGSIQ